MLAAGLTSSCAVFDGAATSCSRSYSPSVAVFVARLSRRVGSRPRGNSTARPPPSRTTFTSSRGTPSTSSRLTSALAPLCKSWFSAAASSGLTATTTCASLLCAFFAPHAAPVSATSSTNKSRKRRLTPPLPTASRSVAIAPPATTAAATAATVTIAAPRAVVPVLTRRCVLRPFDQLFGRDDGSVLVLGEQLQPDAPAILVDFLDDDVEDVAARDHVLDVAHAARADVGHVQQPVGPFLELDERAELRGLDDLRVPVFIADLRALGQALDRGDRRVGLRALGRVDEDRA